MTKKRKKRIKCKCADRVWSSTQYPSRPFDIKRLDRNHYIITKDVMTFDDGMLGIRRVSKTVSRQRMVELRNWVKCLEYFRHKCAYCGAKLTANNTTRDHFIPRAKGGSKRAGTNIVPSCPQCNYDKADTHPGKWCNETQLERIYNYIWDFRIKHHHPNISWRVVEIEE